MLSRDADLTLGFDSYHPSPFFVLDEVDAALDNTNVARVARYVQNIASPDFQYVRRFPLSHVEADSCFCFPSQVHRHQSEERCKSCCKSFFLS